MTQQWEIEGFLEAKDGKLHIDGVNAVELAREYGTPLFVYSEPRIKHNVARLKKVQQSIGCNLKLCYAGKAMSTIGILRAIKDAGSDLEVNSGGELWKALQAGFTGDQINFNGISKEIWELELAINSEIYAIQVDSVYELELIEETARRLNKKANVSLRLVPEIEANTHSGLQTALLTSKFGMMTDEAYEAFRKYSNNPHLNLCGIHLHIGSQIPEPSPYTQAFKTMFESLVHIFNETGVKLQHINLGGGFPVNYLRDKNQQSEFPAEEREMFEADFEPQLAIKKAWDEVYADADAKGLTNLFEDFTLLLEPGRSIVADAAVCLTTVRNHKQRPISNEQQTKDKGQSDSESSTVHYPLSAEYWLLTDAGFNILLSMETYKWYYHLISADNAAAEHTRSFKVAGPLCDGGDVYFDIEGHGRLPDHRLLPADTKPGSVLALLNCGAYSLAQASQYNARLLPSVILTKADGSVDLIRRRDNFEDLVNNDIY